MVSMGPSAFACLCEGEFVRLTLNHTFDGRFEIITEVTPPPQRVYIDATIDPVSAAGFRSFGVRSFSYWPGRMTIPVIRFPWNQGQ